MFDEIEVSSCDGVVAVTFINSTEEDDDEEDELSVPNTITMTFEEWSTLFDTIKETHRVDMLSRTPPAEG